MTITANALTRAAGVAAVAAGVIFIGVQIGHPQLDATVITTTNVYVRDQLKVLMAVLALAGITGMYLSQIRRNGVLGLIGTYFGCGLPAHHVRRLHRCLDVTRNCQRQPRLRQRRHRSRHRPRNRRG